MFRLQDNVPEVYVQESRDFQLFTRLYDAVFGGVKFSIDSLQNATNTRECNALLLELLKTKLGLYTDLQISDTELRYVLEAFPLIMRYKGSFRAIKYILNLFQRIVKDNSLNYSCSIINKDDTILNENYTIKFKFSRNLKYQDLLMELIKLVVPTGYNVTYEITKFQETNTTIKVSNSLQVFRNSQSYILDNYISEDEYDLPEEEFENDANDLTSVIGIATLELIEDSENLVEDISNEEKVE